MVQIRNMIVKTTGMMALRSIEGSAPGCPNDEFPCVNCSMRLIRGAVSFRVAVGGGVIMDSMTLRIVAGHTGQCVYLSAEHHTHPAVFWQYQYSQYRTQSRVHPRV